MVDKITAVRRERIGQRLGQADGATIRSVQSVLAFAVGMS
jgi:mRNA-degrading endonuclease toxin of MazEF toxin-antitoxin module